jgi:hypothetical protein
MMPLIDFECRQVSHEMPLFGLPLLLLPLSLVSGAIVADEITSLPGWKGALPSKQYSGYLTVPGDAGPKQYHCE